MPKRLLLVLLVGLLPAVAQAWWNKDWGYRKQIVLDTTPAGGNVAATVNDVPLLVRLSLGNFGYFADTQANGADLRFVAADDVTPLPYHIEAYDPTGQMAFVWVRVPHLTGASDKDSIYMYYGNGSATAGAEAPATYDVNQVLVYHFESTTPRDATAYGNQPAASNAEANTASLIGAGVHFAGAQSLSVPASPSLRLLPDKGFTASAWVNLDAPQADAYVLELTDTSGNLVLGIDGNAPYVRLTSATGVVETPRSATIDQGAWVHLAVSAGGGELRLYVNGARVATVPAAALPEIGGTLTAGASAAGGHFLSAQLDELQASNIVRSPDWLAAAVASQGMAGTMLKYGEDAQAESSGGQSYFIITLRNVTVDGWVVIGILGVMSMVSWMIMVAKGLVIRRVRKDNAAFLRKFEAMAASDPAALDHEETEDERDAEDHPLLAAAAGDHAHFQSSTIYRLYHAGLHEVKQRVAGATVSAQRRRGLTIESIDAIRAAMDAKLVRETQKLNGQMVLLTLAIAGGPFLGLLGTVIGVMITFAAIAASGDVNVNAIAPGIAASLAATVAGLVVAIPALFGYNYLSTRIKEIVADMRVFLDEFVTRIAEHYSMA